jgi:hypothetical protein
MATICGATLEWVHPPSFGFQIADGRVRSEAFVLPLEADTCFAPAIWK